MKLGPVIDHAKAQLPAFKTVEGLDELAAIATAQAPLPALYLVPAASSYVAEQEGAGLIVVRDDEDFDAVIVVGFASQRGRNRDELADLADDVITVLLGWTPDAEFYRPFVPTSARLLGLAGGRASWLIRFRTSSRLRKQG